MAGSEEDKGATSSKPAVTTDSNVIHFAYSTTYAPYNRFSLFWPQRLVYKGVAFRSGEHIFQCGKAMNQQDFISIRDANLAVDARKIGHSLPKERIRPDWDTYKIRRMKEILMCKYTQSQDLRNLLVSTEDKVLIHTAPWDAFWGSGKDGKGQNRLGKMTMEVRTVIQQEVKLRG